MGITTICIWNLGSVLGYPADITPAYHASNVISQCTISITLMLHYLKCNLCIIVLKVFIIEFNSKSVSYDRNAKVPSLCIYHLICTLTFYLLSSVSLLFNNEFLHSRQQPFESDVIVCCS